MRRIKYISTFVFCIRVVAFSFSAYTEAYKMADLDDFFAKKDRKKAKGKKFTTADEIAKKLEETGKKIEKTKKDKVVLPLQTSGQGEEEQGNQVEVSISLYWKLFFIAHTVPVLVGGHIVRICEVVCAGEIMSTVYICCIMNFTHCT